jgi:hypothetical protein
MGLRYRLEGSGLRTPVQNSLEEKLTNTGVRLAGGAHYPGTLNLEIEAVI